MYRKATKNTCFGTSEVANFMDSLGNAEKVLLEFHYSPHWNGAISLVKFSALATEFIDKMTTFGATSNENSPIWRHIRFSVVTKSGLLVILYNAQWLLTTPGFTYLYSDWPSCRRRSWRWTFPSFQPQHSRTGSCWWGCCYRSWRPAYIRRCSDPSTIGCHRSRRRRWVNWNKAKEMWCTITEVSTVVVQ